MPNKNEIARKKCKFFMFQSNFNIGKEMKKRSGRFEENKPGMMKIEDDTY